MSAFFALLMNKITAYNSVTLFLNRSKEGKNREKLGKVRVNQSFFRSSILASYNNTCCITGIKQPELLIAGHIKSWSEDEKNRLNPRNGIAINALHDKAFESGLLTITPDFRIKISQQILKDTDKEIIEEYFFKDLYRNNLPVSTCSFARPLRLPLPVGRLKILVIATAMPAFFALWSNKITAYNSVTLFLNRS